MRNSKFLIIITIMLCGLFMLSLNIMGQTKIDVEKEVKAKINADPGLIAKLIKRLFNEDVKGSDYELVEFKIAKMNQISTPRIDLTSLTKKWMFVTSQQVVNCTGDQVTKTLSLTGTMTSEKSITKTMNFSYSYSGTVGLDIEIFSGSATSTWSAGYSQSWQDTETETYTASDVTSIVMNEIGGRVYTLLCRHLQGSIPYEATYEIADNSIVRLKFKGKSGYIYPWTDVNYNGAGRKYTLGTKVSELKGTMHDSISSLRVSGGVKGILYQGKNFGGKSMTFTQDTKWVGNDFNDKTSSLKVERKEFATAMPIVLYKQIKNLIPLSVKQFTAKGKIDIDYSYKTPETQVVINELDSSVVTETCKTYSGGAMAGAPSSQLKQKTLTKEQYERLLKSGKIK